jgi:tetratricopeptide (TPR) repeat protein
MNPLTSWARAVPLLLLVLFSFFIAPSVFWYDDAEFISAVFCLGIPHPTGFPLYDTLARGFTLLPLGSVAFRVHLASMAFSLCAGWLGLRLLARLGVEIGPSIMGFAGLLFLATPTLFLHAAAAEVYALNLLLVTLALHLAADVVGKGPDPDRRSYLLLGLLSGLAIGGHVAGAMMVWAVTGLVTLMQLRRLGLKLPLMALGLFVLGASVLAYLPIRAAAQPFRNWGDPSSWAAFVDHVSGGRILRSFDTQVGQASTGSRLVYAELLAGVIGEELSIFLLLSGIGIALLVRSARERRARPLLALVGVVVALDLAFSLLANPMGIADRQTSSVTLLVLVLAAVAPLAWLLARAARRLAMHTALAVSIPVLPLALMPAAVFEADLGADHHALSLAQAAFDQVPPGGMLVTNSDHLNAGALYLQGVESYRLDALHLVSVHAVESSHLRALLALHPPWRFSDSLRGLPDRLDADPASRESTTTQLSTLHDLITTNLSQRPVLWEAGLDVYERSLFRTRPEGFPVGLVKGGPPPGDDASAALDPSRRERPYRVQLRDYLLRADARLSRWTRGVLSTYLSQAATARARQGDQEVAVTLLARALKLDDLNHKALTNLGALLSRQEHFAQAIALTERAVMARPDYVTGVINLARYLAFTGRADEAQSYMDDALALDPGEGTRKKIRDIEQMLEARAR